MVCTEGAARRVGPQPSSVSSPDGSTISPTITISPSRTGLPWTRRSANVRSVDCKQQGDADANEHEQERESDDECEVFKQG